MDLDGGSGIIFRRVFHGAAESGSCLCMADWGGSVYISLDMCLEKCKKYDAVYEGVAQVVVAYPLTVQYLKPDRNKVASQVDEILG